MMRRFLLILFFLAVSRLAVAGSVENLRIWGAPDSTRVVLDTDTRIDYTKILLADPHRVVLDIKDTPLYKPPSKSFARDRYLNGIRTARRNGTDLRVVLDLKRPARVNVFQLKPNRRYKHRLVIDLLPAKAAAPDAADMAIRGVLAPKRESGRDVVIAIDAGHGGDDPGAIGKHGTYEKDVVLQIALLLAKRLDRQVGMRAVLVREGDYFLPLRRRMEKAREAQADLFISLHADAFHDHRVRGSSVYILSQRGASSEHARWLAERENLADLMGGVNPESQDNDNLLTTLLDLSQTASLESSEVVAERVLKGLERIGRVHRKHVQSAGFVVLKSPDIPSILIETAFISNPSEEKKLLDKAYQKRLVGALVDSLRGYYTDYPLEGTLLAQQNTQRKYVVRPGDTLLGIAKQYRVSLQRLRDHNNIEGDVLQIGRTISIPSSDS